jgi:hypothetical protein
VKTDILSELIIRMNFDSWICDCDVLTVMWRLFEKIRYSAEWAVSSLLLQAIVIIWVTEGIAVSLYV